MTGNERVLQALSDGRWHTHLELYGLGVVLHSRISELRSPKGGGHNILMRRESGYDMERRVRTTTYWYRLMPPAALEGDAPAAASPSSAAPSSSRAALDTSGSGETAAGAVSGGCPEHPPSVVSYGLPALTLDDIGVDQALRDANAESPEMLTEVGDDGEPIGKRLTLDENRARLAELQQSLFGDRQAA